MALYNGYTHRRWLHRLYGKELEMGITAIRFEVGVVDILTRGSIFWLLCNTRTCCICTLLRYPWSGRIWRKKSIWWFFLDIRQNHFLFEMEGFLNVKYNMYYCLIWSSKKESTFTKMNMTLSCEFLWKCEFFLENGIKNVYYWLNEVFANETYDRICGYWLLLQSLWN